MLGETEKFLSGNRRARMGIGSSDLPNMVGRGGGEANASWGGGNRVGIGTRQHPVDTAVLKRAAYDARPSHFF